jgi:hypothetical protein
VPNHSHYETSSYGIRQTDNPARVLNRMVRINPILGTNATITFVRTTILMRVDAPSREQLVLKYGELNISFLFQPRQGQVDNSSMNNRLRAFRGSTLAHDDLTPMKIAMLFHTISVISIQNFEKELPRTVNAPQQKQEISPPAKRSLRHRANLCSVYSNRPSCRMYTFPNRLRHGVIR